MSDTYPDDAVLTSLQQHVVLKRDGGWLLLDNVPSLLAWCDAGAPALRRDATAARIAWAEISADPTWRLADARLVVAAYEFAKYVL